MTVAQEDALYDFLDSALEPFTVADAVAFIKQADTSGFRRLGEEAAAFIVGRRLAFPLAEDRWISRRGWFEGGRFAVAPSRLEILNGILIPGHRCVPFANPILLPHEYRFLWKGAEVPMGTTEGPPEDFYPYYSLFGEEYAPQYLAKDNPENEDAFNADPFEDPPEVSVHTLDMRSIYRETAFVPGSRFVVRLADWKAGVFELERVESEPDPEGGAALWLAAAEAGFKASFEGIGPGASTEEQIAFAYWYGGERLKAIPAYALEEFLYEKTESIDIVAYGMESRFWTAGKEIPDAGPWSEEGGPPDKTDMEFILYSYGVPVSEYVVQAYVRDAFYRNDLELKTLAERVVPPPIAMSNRDQLYLANYLLDTIEEFREGYNRFADRDMGPIRRRAGELHTAVVELTARLTENEADTAWLPKHSFVILSQIQTHSAHLLEDLDADEAPEGAELEAMDNSLDGMVETYEDIKDRIEEAQDTFRRSRLSVIRPADPVPGPAGERTMQAALSGTDVWRRFVVPESCTLADLHRAIQVLFGWSGGRLHGFVVDGEVFGPEEEGGERAERETSVSDLAAEGVTEFIYHYDYGAEWEIRLSILHHHGTASALRCLAGAGAAPPEHIGGVLRFRRFVSALRKGEGPERQTALAELGPDFDADAFDMDACNRALGSLSQ